jgi:DNA-binding NarL/FixJ family response regulator
VVPVRVLIVDDQQPFRRAAAAVVEMTDPFILVGTVGSGEECLAVVAHLRPDLVLLDVGLPGIDGVEAAARLAELAPAPAVVLVSTHDENELGDGVARSGAVSYISKSAFGPGPLAAAWEVVTSGSTARSPAPPSGSSSSVS